MSTQKHDPPNDPPFMLDQLHKVEQNKDMVSLFIMRTDFGQVMAVLKVRALEARQASRPRPLQGAAPDTSGVCRPQDPLSPALLRIRQSYREEAEELDRIIGNLERQG